MPRRKRVPKYGLHKSTGQARVVINDEHVYLGAYGSPQSREKYARLIAEHFSVPEPCGSQTKNQNTFPSISVNELLLSYWRFAEGWYVQDGKPTKELANIKDAMRPLRALYSHTPANAFGPRALKAVREYMIEVEDLSRGVVNSRINRIRRVFKWAVSEETIAPSVYEGLRTVDGLRYGRNSSRETEPVKPVPRAWVEATQQFVAPQIADMLELQWLTGMRSQDVVQIRPCDIDTRGDIWIYTPPAHKTRYRGHSRVIPLGPKARAIIKRYLDRPLDAHLFSPREADTWRRRQLRQLAGKNRKTPIYPSELRRRERLAQLRRRRTEESPLRDHYDTATYYRAVTYGIKKARKAGTTIPHWFPNQLRHSKATEVRKHYGIEAAQVVLGHSRADVTQVYAERNLDLAKRVAGETG